MKRYILFWKWHNLDSVFSMRSDNFAQVLWFARGFEACDWCIQNGDFGVILAQSKSDRRWERIAE